MQRSEGLESQSISIDLAGIYIETVESTFLLVSLFPVGEHFG